MSGKGLFCPFDVCLITVVCFDENALLFSFLFVMEHYKSYRMNVSQIFFKTIAFVRKIHRKHLRWSLIKKETLTQVFSCEFCEIFKDIFSKEHLRAIAFEVEKV